MKVLKTFLRDGKRYRPGDDAPADMDALALAHYQRHGMVGQPAKPVRAPRKPTAASINPADPGESLPPADTTPAADTETDPAA